VNRVVEPDALLPTAMKLAADMASIPVETLSQYKAIIDGGYALPFGDGLAFEHRESRAANSKVTPEMVETRRAAIQARGRSQG
jgi:enoyl-CoA hydratase